MPINLVVDFLFLVTVALLILNGLKNGALFSLISLLVLPIGFAVAFFFGPALTVFLASSGVPVAPLIAYAVLFIGTILVLHVVGNVVVHVLKIIPGFDPVNRVLGGVIGFVEAWLIWFILLWVLGTFLGHIQDAGINAFPGVDLEQFNKWNVPDWYNLYNDTVNYSLFAQVNNFFAKLVPIIPSLPRLK